MKLSVTKRFSRNLNQHIDYERIIWRIFNIKKVKRVIKSRSNISKNLTSV